MSRFCWPNIEFNSRKEVSKDRFIDVRMEPILEMKLEKMREHVWDNVACR